MPATQSTIERDEHLQRQWLREFGAHSIAVLVDRATADCPLKNEKLQIGGRLDQLRLAISFAIEANTTPEERVGWASKIDSDVLDFEEFLSREDN